MPLVDYIYSLSELKKAMEEMGAKLPDNFTTQLEMHLRVFVARYQERKKPEEWGHKNRSTIPRILRRFFSKPIVESNGYYVSYDKDFIRGWKTDVMDRPKRVEKEAPPEIVNDVQMAFNIIRMNDAAKIEVREILDVTPRTRSRRMGQYAYVKFSLTKDNECVVKYSSERETLPDVLGYLPSFYGHDYVRVFMTTMKSLVYVESVSGRLLLFNEKFFLMTRE